MKSQNFDSQSSFDYTELCSGAGGGAGTAVVLESGSVIGNHHQPLIQIQNTQPGQIRPNSTSGGLVSSGATTPNSNGQPRSRPWHDFGRQNDADKIQIPKL